MLYPTSTAGINIINIKVNIALVSIFTRWLSQTGFIWYTLFKIFLFFFLSCIQKKLAIFLFHHKIFGLHNLYLIWFGFNFIIKFILKYTNAYKEKCNNCNEQYMTAIPLYHADLYVIFLVLYKFILNHY